MLALSPPAKALAFMTAANMPVGGIDCHVSRSGYTGEDGFEISVAAERANELARRLLAQAGVEPIGLGARDSLRLEAGLCLYGHDIDETTSPVEAGLAWSIQKRRRFEGGFPVRGASARSWRRE
jgi:aminomethyltransferase